MRIRHSILLGGLAAAGLAAAPQAARAWGHTGHLEVSGLAMEALPPDLPAFLRRHGAAREVSELGAEPDVSKTAGGEHDQDLDPGHYVDLDDAGKVLGILPLAPLPATRLAYDTALRAGGSTQYGAGYLPYTIIIGWQQLQKDFAYWRAETIGLRSATDPQDKAYFRTQLELREKLIRRDLGVWSHYVADASQPLHVSVHFNGWGDYPNPENLTQDRTTHAQFEGAFVRQYVRPEAIAAAVPDYRDCGCSIEQRTVQYLQASLGQVVPLYRLATRGAFTTADPEGIAFATERLAAGVAELRDMVVDAWSSSATAVVGFPLIKVADIESGKVALTRTSFASD